MIFDIQHYAIHDGPGIRTLVFLKGCPLRCTWCCNPESQSSAPQLRYREIFCQSCHLCANACKKKGVSAGHDKQRAIVDFTRCSTCDTRECCEVCPSDALTVTGREASATTVMSQVARDIPFYKNSGGGVTFSGGEPFFQPEFLASMLCIAKEHNIHTAVETCGFVDSEILLSIEPLIDLFLYDIKFDSEERHIRFTGVSNRLIKENLQTLVRKCPEKISVRVPLIPGANDETDEQQAIDRFLAQMGVSRVSRLPFHAMGLDKYAQHGIPNGDVEANA
jgi:pyruvate formate lyase activating enzyme